MTSRWTLMQRIDLYLRRTRMPPTRFGREAVGDPRFLLDLRNGREPRASTIARIGAWLDARDGEGA